MEYLTKAVKSRTCLNIILECLFSFIQISVGGRSRGHVAGQKKGRDRSWPKPQKLNLKKRTLIFLLSETPNFGYLNEDLNFVFKI
ncbi:hypothetical protein BpHYR1_010599 [Brachionus plicatilis]|uniref:Uncharacterized protein n=1 Tax=Brachionus plicatilis TaxID=10195 RepID=A0A3M7S6N9_BRAPC|nr:hypothetical protein BpHYR1_010599 [Brachionus plicatilis]